MRFAGVGEIDGGALEVLGVEEDAGVVAAEVDVLEALEDVGEAGASERAPRHLNVECRIDAPILLNAVVVEVPQEVDVRGEDQHALALN